jgi:peptidoglycan-N-acetylglucosamine deacetylase
MDGSKDGAVERRSLLRIGLGAAVAVAATGCGDIGHQAAVGPATRSPATAKTASRAPSTGVAPASAQPPATATPATSPSAASQPSAVAQQWTEPVYRVPQILPDAPANAIALTIDDGPHPIYTPMVLEVLQHYGVLATFSMIGINVQSYPEVARQVVAAGHTICNHSMWHPIPFTALSPAAIDAEVAGAMNQIWDATRTVPRLFRAPGGAWSPPVFQALSPYGLVPIDWDVDPRDWTLPGVAAIEQVLDSGQGGDILLCHDGGGNRIETVTALNEVIPALLARKLEFVTL